MTGRVTWLDTSRGIGIILVVLGHAERGIVSAGLTHSPWWSTGDIALYTFHMPLFMFLAGINVPGSLRKGRAQFIRDKILTIAYPYLIWSLIQGVLLIIFSRWTNSAGTDWRSLAAIAWEPISPFWFLYALFTFMLVVFIFEINLYVLIPLMAIGIWTSGILIGDNIVHQICYQFTFFCLGAIFSQHIRSARFHPPATWLIVLFVAWLASFQIVPVEGPTPYLTPWSIPAAIAGIGVVLVTSQWLHGTASVWLGYVGSASMSIYVMHILATAGTRIAIHVLHLKLPPLALLSICTVFGVLLPLAAHFAFSRVGLLPILGLGKKIRKVV